VPAKIGKLRAEWAAAGRAGDPLIHVLSPGKPTPALLAGWAELGVTEAVWGMPDRAPDEVAAFVERLAGKLGIPATPAERNQRAPQGAS
jgi:hypothetical protein